MKVTIARHAGFCMGVKKAMNMALEASESSSEKIFTLGPLVHNNDAVNMLKKNDIYPADVSEDIHDKKVFIRAHGVPPEVKEKLVKKGNTIIDATCPYVLKVQNIAKEYTEKGYSVVIVGDRGHAEVEGLLGYCAGNGYVVPDKEAVSALPDLERICVIAQTTQNREKFLEVISSLEDRFSSVIVENTICGATSIRQKEVLELVELVDIMIVVGGRHSANTRRLEELSLSTGTPTILIENASQLNTNDLRRFSHVGITAGASTPSWVIDEVAKKVGSIEAGSVAAFIESITDFLIETSTFLSFGAIFLYYSIAYFLGVNAFDNVLLPIIIFLFINAVHFLNSSIAERAKLKNNKDLPFFSLERLGIVVATSYLFLSLILSYFTHAFIFTVHLILCASGLVYSKIRFPKGVANTIKFKSLKEIPASKDITQAFAWVILIVWYPAIYNGLDILRPKIWVASFFVGCIVFARSITYDIREIRLDKLIGKETLPVLLGDKNAKLLLFAIIGILMAGLIYTKVVYFTYIKINIFIYSLIYMITYLYLFHKKIVYKGRLLNLIIDGQFFFAGIITHLFYI